MKWVLIKYPSGLDNQLRSHLSIVWLLEWKSTANLPSSANAAFISRPRVTRSLRRAPHAPFLSTSALSYSHLSTIFFVRARATWATPVSPITTASIRRSRWWSAAPSCGISRSDCANGCVASWNVYVSATSCNCDCRSSASPISWITLKE